MKRLAILVLISLLSIAGARAATRYIDMGCTFNGDGTAIDCAAGGAGVGPYNDWTTANAAGINCGDTVNFRGIHTTHGSNHGNDSSTGRYFHDYVDMHGKACTGGTPIILQPNGYTVPGTGETVFLDGTAAPSWTQCAWDGSACDCDAGNQNVQIGAGGSTACTETWYMTGSGTFDKALGFQKPDGSPTYRVASLALMTNASAGYNGKACHTTTWMRCNAASDCPTGEACDGSSSEIDSFTTEAIGGVGLARWAATPTGATCRAYNNADGIAFYIYNSSFITIRGFNMRAHVREGVSFLNSGGATLDSTITDNRIYYSCYQKNSGPDYGIAVRQSNRITVSANNLGYSTSEGIHTRTLATGATTYMIQDNWIHDTGDQNVLGPQCSGTPSGVILTDDYSGGDGNYAGSIFEGNLIQRPATHDSTGGSVGRGMIIEDDSSGWIVRNNQIDSPAGECLKLDASVSASSNQFYNNILNGCGSNFGPAGGGGTCVYLYANNGGANCTPGLESSCLQLNKFYNNTLSGCANHAFVLDCGSGTCASNEFKNNILKPATGKECMEWPTNTDATNLFDFNDCITSANPAVKWLNVTRTCANLNLAGAGNLTTCTDAPFVNEGAKDFHIVTGALAKNAGTATGMPAGRTADVCNAITVNHGLPSYSDCQGIQGGVWDIGIDEFVAVSSSTSQGIKLNGTSIK